MTSKYVNSNKQPTVAQTGKEDALLICEGQSLKTGVLQLNIDYFIYFYSQFNDASST